MIGDPPNENGGTGTVTGLHEFQLIHDTLVTPVLAREHLPLVTEHLDKFCFSKLWNAVSRISCNCTCMAT